MKIRTTYEYPPIPIRCFDWSAIDAETYDGCEDGNNVCGWGKTEQEATADLLQQIGSQQECPRKSLETDQDGFPVDCGYPGCNCKDAAA